MILNRCLPCISSNCSKNFSRLQFQLERAHLSQLVNLLHRFKNHFTTSDFLSKEVSDHVFGDGGATVTEKLINDTRNSYAFAFFFFFGIYQGILFLLAFRVEYSAEKDTFYRETTFVFFIHERIVSFCIPYKGAFVQGPSAKTM